VGRTPDEQALEGGEAGDEVEVELAVDPHR
jgi:hypothetical protein